MAKDQVTLIIKEACLVQLEGKGTVHVAVGEQITVPIDDAHSIVGSGRAYLAPNEELPSSLKGGARPAARR